MSGVLPLKQNSVFILLCQRCLLLYSHTQTLQAIHVCFLKGLTVRPFPHRLSKSIGDCVKICYQTAKMNLLPLLQSTSPEHTTLLWNSCDIGDDAVWSSIPTFTMCCNITQTYVLVKKCWSGLYKRFQDLRYLVARCSCLSHCDKLYLCTVTQKKEVIYQ